MEEKSSSLTVWMNILKQKIGGIFHSDSQRTGGELFGACRDPDWKYLGLGEGKEAIYEPSDGKIKQHWDRFTGLTWGPWICRPQREESLEHLFRC